MDGRFHSFYPDHEIIHPNQSTGGFAEFPFTEQAHLANTTNIRLLVQLLFNFVQYGERDHYNNFFFRL